MKISLSLKLGIFVVILFGLLCIGMALWRPVRVRYYSSRLDSGNAKVRADAVRKLLELGKRGREPVFEYYSDRYDSRDVKERMAVVDELCECGDKGKELMREIFLGRCMREQARIPAGTLTRENGSKVKIKSLYVDKYEVTHEKYYVFTKLSEYDPDFFWENEIPPNWAIDHPASKVSLFDAIAYADWLGMRLPNEYEWVYSARAGSTGKYCFGDNGSLLDEYAWYVNNSGKKPHPVGQKKPNNWGLYDVHGNVSEWCETIRITYSGIGAIGTVKGKKLSWMGTTGGSFSSDADECALNSGTYGPGNMGNVGFRVVRDVE